MRSPYLLPQDRNDNEFESIKAIDVERYERCAYCHAKLAFEHELDVVALQVIEVSKCNVCGVASNPRKFKLQ